MYSRKQVSLPTEVYLQSGSIDEEFYNNYIRNKVPADYLTEFDSCFPDNGFYHRVEINSNQQLWLFETGDEKGYCPVITNTSDFELSDYTIGDDDDDDNPEDNWISFEKFLQLDYTSKEFLINLFSNKVGNNPSRFKKN